MLIQLMPEQIANNWDFLKTAVVSNTPMETTAQEIRLNNILAGLLVGDLHLWVATNGVTGNVAISGVVVTQILSNPIAGNRNLLIYSVYGFNSVMTKKEWTQNLLTLVKFARKQKCQQVIAYTNNEQLIEMCRSLNGDVSQRLIVFNLEKG